MKTVLVGILCAMLLPIAGLSAANDPAEEKAIMAALDAMVKATKGRDEAALNKVYHDDLMYSHTSGLTQTKAEVIKSAMTTKSTLEGITFDKSMIKIFGPTALVANNTTMNTTMDGKPRQSDLHALWVLVKGPQGWQIASRHVTRLEPPKP